MIFPMDSSTISMTVAIVLLVMMSAYFSATETAFSCLNKIRMKSRAESGDHRAALAMDLVEDYDRLISTILIGNNIVNITASTVGTVLFTKLYAAYGPTVSTVVLTLVVLIFGEISPKSLAKEHAESFAMFSAPILRVFLLVLRPLNFLFSQWKRLLNMIFHPSEDQGITEEELITMVSEAENEGGLDQHESQLIRSAIEFGDLEAGDILTPRVDIVAVEDSASMEEIAAVFAESGYSRLPVYHKDVDDIVGVIHEKDFNAARYRGQGNISGCITPVHYTTANADLGLLLRTLQKKKTHMAIVVDEYGGTEGLLTMEDILEELVGEIWDEHDEEEVFIRKVDKDTYLVDAAMDFDDFAEFFHLNEETEMTSVSGWVMEQCDRVPEVGDRFSCQDLDVLVTRVDNHRTCEIKVVRREASGGEITDET